METYYILRLGKELRNKLITLRKELYQNGSHYSVLSLEPCIILGRIEHPAPIRFVTCPKLPLITEDTVAYTQGHLYIPLCSSPLTQIREQLNTSFHYDGIYLGERAIDLSIDPVIVADVSLALLTIKKEGELITWHVSSERHLYSGKEQREDTHRS